MEDYVKSYARTMPGMRRAAIEAYAGHALSGEKATVPAAHGPVEVYLHRAARPGAPVVFEMHGGGMVMGDAAFDDTLRQLLCGRAGVNVVGINYRKAPEHRYPAALDDVCGAIRYFALHAGSYGFDGERLGVLGFSAGGTLAAAAALRLKAEGGPALCCQVLHYPFVDSFTPPDEKPRFESELTDDVLTAFVELYSTPAQRREPYVSPLCAGAAQLAGLPPAAVILSRRDSLFKEGEQYAQKLARAGVPVLLKVMPDAAHGYVESYFQERYPEDACWAARHDAVAALALTAAFLQGVFDR